MERGNKVNESGCTGHCQGLQYTRVMDCVEAKRGVVNPCCGIAYAVMWGWTGRHRRRTVIVKPYAHGKSAVLTW
ncbi:hypothetical protein PLEOSDRAFT_1091116 [Pleurotus ostreatus PC15]|uniref:Uncharacterized protein n=1 Tax=Pleurotus ostreatus (strain PC15) TaxID=1137138 RepID=A0A067N4S4_PLEO1|nr:hypothetical protein PLEOSDRAFT_1091116 [Pleurotus ostreatus PC15]